MFRSVLMAIAFLIVGSVSNAALVAGHAKGTWSKSSETNVIVASKGLAFISVAYNQAKIIKEMYPNNQILVITTLPAADSSSRNAKQRELKKQGFSIIEEKDSPLTNKALIRIISENTSNIRSLDIIGHNGVELGPWLEDTTTRLDYKNSQLMGLLKPLFNKNGFARLQGCNTGWNVAPALSKAWGVPILSSFTSTSMYFLSKSGTYELMPEETVAKTKAAKIDPTSGMSCPKGMCQILIPEASPYHFHVHRSPKAAWLPYRKAICDSSIDDSRCEVALAEGLLTSAGPLSRKKALSDRNSFKQLLEYSVCASHSSLAAQQVCLRTLRKAQDQGGITSLPYRNGEMLKCSGLRSCQFVQDSIDLRRNSSANSASSVELYFEHALRGFDLLGGTL